MHKLRIMKISRGNVEAKRNKRMKRCIELDGKIDYNKKKSRRHRFEVHYN